MIYIESDSTDAYYNFGLEYYLCEVAPRDELVFLLWRTEPTLLIGKYQNPYEEVNLNYARGKGIHLVRRLSGGGTIFTDLGGWQFSFIDPRGDETIRFEEYIEPVVVALRDMGADVSFTGRNDLLLAGKKISGNAQYKLAGRTVHHGSLLFATNLEDLTLATKVNAGKIQSKSIQSVRDRVGNISDYLEEKMSPERFKEELLKRLTTGTVEYLAEEEKAEVEKLADLHFRSREAIYGKTPRFTNEREKRFSSGLIKVFLDIHKGKIREIKFSGDYFASADFELIVPALTDCSYDTEAVRSALAGQVPEGAIYGVSHEELAHLIVGP